MPLNLVGDTTNYIMNNYVRGVEACCKPMDGKPPILYEGRAVIDDLVTTRTYDNTLKPDPTHHPGQERRNRLGEYGLRTESVLDYLSSTNNMYLVGNANPGYN